MDKDRDLDISENALIIFATDNGAWQSVCPDADMRRFRGTNGIVQKGGARVLVIAWWPRHVKAGSRTPEEARGREQPGCAHEYHPAKAFLHFAFAANVNPSPVVSSTSLFFLPATGLLL